MSNFMLLLWGLKHEKSQVYIIVGFFRRAILKKNTIEKMKKKSFFGEIVAKEVTKFPFFRDFLRFVTSFKLKIVGRVRCQRVVTYVPTF